MSGKEALGELKHVQGTPLKKIVKYAVGRGFTDVAVFNEDRKHVNGLLLIHLPAGPTAHFKLSSLKLSKDIKVGPCSGMSTCLLLMLLSETPKLCFGRYQYPCIGQILWTAPV